MSYGEAIVDAIHNAKALVLVFSGHANASPQIEREVERAINQRIPVIPLRIEDVAPDKALEYFLSTPHWLDAFTPPLERHLRNLAGQIHRLIKTDDVRAAETAAAAVTSPFKTVQTTEPAAEKKTEASVPPSSPSPPPPPKPEAVPPKPENAPLGAGAFAAAAAAASSAGPGTGSTSPGGSVPHASTGSSSSPVDFFKKLDTPQQVGIGAGVLALAIGIGWLLSGSSSDTPTPYVSSPGFALTPNGDVNTSDGKENVHVGTDGVRVTDNETPATRSAPQSPDNDTQSPSSPRMPSDGDVIPGRTPPGGPTAPSGNAAVTTNPAGGVYPAVTGGDVASVLNEAGYDSTVSTDNEGDPMVRGTIGGYKFSIFFYRCNKQATPETCLDLQFHSSFTNDNNISDDKVNAYNRDNRFGQAYFMQNGDIGLDMSATLQGGVSREHIKQVIDWWKVTLTNFSSKVGG